VNKLLPTSTAGSLPKPSWLAQPEKLWSPWKLEGEELADGKRDALLLSLQEQAHAGIDIVSDGEPTRQHFVTTFIEHLDGVEFCPSTNCGMAPLGRQVARGKLHALAAGAAIVRRELGMKE
jgi:methionine synthase II (cobalamin-independent)